MTDHHFPIEMLHQIAAYVRQSPPPAKEPEPVSNNEANREFRMVRRLRRMMRRPRETITDPPPVPPPVPPEPPVSADLSLPDNRLCEVVTSPMPEPANKDQPATVETTPVQGKPNNLVGAFTPQADDVPASAPSNANPTVGIGCLFFAFVALMKMIMFMAKDAGR
ncbi:MAG: hypothetical protein U0798_13710 [Gemmataceae bacterium]